MIKEKTIKIKVVGRTIKSYKELGYNCKVNDIIDVSIGDLPKQSHSKITAICDDCGKEKELSLYAYWKNYNKYNKYTCNKCKQHKIEKTNLEKYGTRRPIQNKKIREKLENTNLEKYGSKIATKNDIVIKKIINTNLEKYGVTSTAKLNSTKDKQRQTIEKNLLDKYKNFNILSINDNICTFQCEHGHTFDINFSNLHNRLKYNVTLCTVCNPITHNISDSENTLLEFIKENYDDVIITNNREILDGKELDIYLPKLNLAFEYNGLYWHSEQFKDNYYHKDKTDKCKEKEIDLYHIWEDDWLYKREIIKSMILNKLGKSNFKIYARKCEIKTITDNDIIREFLNNNHIQGFTGSKIKLGLYFNDELVSLMTFKKTNNNYELNRFCSKLNTNIIGSFSKLLSHFKRNYTFKNIYTFADLSYSNGNIYEKFFILDKTLKPDYKYIVDGKRIHKFNYRGKNEKEVMLKKGIYKIYNCGLKKYKLLDG